MNLFQTSNFNCVEQKTKPDTKITRRLFLRELNMLRIWHQRMITTGAELAAMK